MERLKVASGSGWPPLEVDKRTTRRSAGPAGVGLAVRSFTCADFLSQFDELAQVLRVVIRVLLLLLDERIQELGHVVVVPRIHRVLVHNGLTDVVDDRLRGGSGAALDPRRK